MTSMIGTSTLVGFSLIRSISGSSHWTTHSQCASRKTSVSPFAKRAPAKRARIKPSLCAKIKNELSLIKCVNCSVVGWREQLLELMLRFKSLSEESRHRAHFLWVTVRCVSCRLYYAAPCCDIFRRIGTSMNWVQLRVMNASRGLS